MRVDLERHTSLALAARLREADGATSELMAEILEVSGRRLLLQGQREQARHLDHLIEADAWIDAALALLELELPLWQLRRIAYDDGEWHCALSRQREIPDWLDESIETQHPDLALAILIAFVEAQETTRARSRTSVPASFGRPERDYLPFSCDNFA